MPIFNTRRPLLSIGKLREGGQARSQYTTASPDRTGLRWSSQLRAGGGFDHSLQFPTHGPLRVAQQLALQGIQVSSGGVRAVWSRHGLMTRHERLLRLGRHVREQSLELSDSQIRLLERFSASATSNLNIPAIWWRSIPSSSAISRV